MLVFTIRILVNCSNWLVVGFIWGIIEYCLW